MPPIRTSDSIWSRSLSVMPPEKGWINFGRPTRISGLTILHLPLGVRVDHLVSQCAQAEIRTLGDKKEILRWWLVNDTAVYGPESPKDSKQATLATAVGAHDQEVLLRKVDHIRSRSRV